MHNSQVKNDWRARFPVKDSILGNNLLSMRKNSSLEPKSTQ